MTYAAGCGTHTERAPRGVTGAGSQSDRRRTSRSQGQGLRRGLYTSRQVVQAHLNWTGIGSQCERIERERLRTTAFKGNRGWLNSYLEVGLGIHLHDYGNCLRQVADSEFK